MKIRDISDRVYQGQVYKLLDSAESSIVISMYLIRPGEDPKHPVNRLLEDLLEACKRGVEVTVYINTKFKNATPETVLKTPWFDKLRRAGAVIRPVSPVRMLHDKLIVVDRKFVVEGSMNWSVSALEDNHESATVIESSELAEFKLKRMSFFPVWGEEGKVIPAKKEVLFPAGPPTSIEIPAALLEERKYFPKMIAYQRERAMKLFLLLLFIARAKGADKFHFPAELAGEFLGILQDKGRSAVRREIVRVLRDLEKIDALLRVEFRFAKDTWVELLPPPGPSFALGQTDFSAGELAVLGENEIFIRLIRVRLREEGKRLEDFTQADIRKRFFIGEDAYRRTLQSRKPSPAPL